MYAAIFMGPFARGPRDDRALIEQCLDMAVQAAEAGFSTITFGEQHFNNYEPYCNPLLMTIVPLPYHNPIRLAEDVNVLDQLLAGRLILGLSAGRVGFSPDFENFGLDPKEQRAIFAEKYAVLEQLWGHAPQHGPLRFDGQWVKGGVHGRVQPISYRAPRPLVAIGSNTEATVRKAGIDGNVMFLGPASLAEAGARYRAYREGLDEGGWDADFKAHRLRHSMVHRQTVVADTDDEAWQIVEERMGFNPVMRRQGDSRTIRQMYEDGLRAKTGLGDQERHNSEVALGWYMAGSPDTLVEQFQAHDAVGIAQIHTRFNTGMWNPEGWQRSFRLFVDEVMPRIDAQTFPELEETEIQAPVREGPLPPLSGADMAKVAQGNLARPPA